MDGYDDIAAAAAARVKQRQADWEARVEHGRAKIRAGYEQTRFLREEEGHRMRVMLEKAVNMITAFFAELDRVRPEIPDELLNDWLFWQVGRTLNSLDQLARIFDFADEDRIRVSLKKARILAKEQAAAERAQVAAEKAAQRAAEEEARRQREAEKAADTAEAERRAALATAQLHRGGAKGLPPELISLLKERLLTGAPFLEKELAREFGITKYRVEAAIEQARGEIRAEARQTGILPEPPKKRRKASVRRRDSRDVLAEMADPEPAPSPAVADEWRADATEMQELAKRFRVAYARLAGARATWIEATLEIASVLRQARERSPSNAAFSAWLKTNGIADKISHQARAALIGMGDDLETAHAALAASDSWSWELIWKEINHLTSARKMDDTPGQTVH